MEFNQPMLQTYSGSPSGVLLTEAEANLFYNFMSTSSVNDLTEVDRTMLETYLITCADNIESEPINCGNCGMPFCSEWTPTSNNPFVCMGPYVCNRCGYKHTPEQVSESNTKYPNALSHTKKFVFCAECKACGLCFQRSKK
jgi:hypothetical protein